MSETRPKEKLDGPNTLSELLHIPVETLAVTFDRFNLTPNDDNACDIVVVKEGTGPKDRFLLMTANANADQIEAQLDQGGIYQMSRRKEFTTHAVYDVPLQAKPLDKERFYPGKQSTETYVSDSELFEGLAEMWSTVYALTSQLPRDCPLSATGLLEFSADSSRLFPIPSFKWEFINDPETAERHFFKTLKEEMAVEAPATNYKDLAQSASLAWKR